MEIRGKISGISKDMITGLTSITFVSDAEGAIRRFYEEARGLNDLRITAVKWREKRSLDANAYFHVLVSKLADVMGISKARCKNEIITSYGQPDYDEHGKPLVLKTNISVDKMLEQELLHCKPCKADIENGTEIVFYWVYRGSHTYNTKEMSILIDGLINECKAQGIETITPDELERLINTWHTKA